MDHTKQITQTGKEKLEQELNDLINNRKPPAVERLHKARSMGDLKENSEYAAAKESLSLIENRIVELQIILTQVQVINGQIDTTAVGVGNQVTVLHDRITEKIYLVGEYESDPLNGRLSISSPIGRALLDKKVGDVVEVKIPAGKTVYKIVSIC